jgi:multimeric flavodoxin WrbA
MNVPPHGQASGHAVTVAPVVVLCCSPRAGGNSDMAGQAVARGVVAAGGECRAIFLREHSVLPCLGCEACAADPENRCVLAGRDEAETIFSALRAASAVVVASPIYFYHVPAGFKALIDRGQRFFHAGHPVAAGSGKKAVTVEASPPRPQVHVLLVSGRKKGARLFDGALLSLKYFFGHLGLEVAEPTLLRGYDKPGDLAADAALGARLAWRGGELWRALSAPKAAGG